MQAKVAVLSLIVLTLAAGCAYTPMFGFPIEQGDVQRGRQAFIDHQCHQCHSIADTRLPPLAGASPPILELGGQTTSIKTYAELMTSIINPDHVVSERYREQLVLQGTIPADSPMPTPHIDNMTVRQLIDMVAFLDARYQFVEGYDSSF